MMHHTLPPLPEDSLGNALKISAELIAQVVEGSTLTDALAERLPGVAYRADAIDALLQGWRGDFPAQQDELLAFSDWLLGALR